MEKLDLVRKFKSYYTAGRTPEIHDFGPVHYLALEGKGDPSGKEFAAMIATLYPVAYALKFGFKEQQQDFAVPKLEALWWFDESAYGNVAMEDTATHIPRSEWNYKLLLRMPDFVTQERVASARRHIEEKKGIDCSGVMLLQLTEGKVVQVLHTGPFDTEPKTLMLLRNFMNERNMQRNGHHHEIYLSDFRKTAPEKLRTILREPYR